MNNPKDQCNDLESEMRGDFDNHCSVYIVLCFVDCVVLSWPLHADKYLSRYNSILCQRNTNVSKECSIKTDRHQQNTVRR